LAPRIASAKATTNGREEWTRINTNEKFGVTKRRDYLVSAPNGQKDSAQGFDPGCNVIERRAL